MSTVTEQASFANQLKESMQGPIHVLSERLGIEVRMWSTWLETRSDGSFGPIVGIADDCVYIDRRGIHDSVRDVKIGETVVVELSDVRPFQTR